MMPGSMTPGSMPPMPMPMPPPPMAPMPMAPEVIVPVVAVVPYSPAEAWLATMLTLSCEKPAASSSFTTRWAVS